jgi:GntR family transcriptional regulator, transcriptional repressor for pyruvate dehydrogenase complex
MGERPKPSQITPGCPPSESGRVRSEQVVERIMELVRSGNLKSGDRLPPERELIEIFEISRPSLREALRSLMTLGVIEIRHGGGAYVSDLTAQTLLAPLDFYLSLSSATMLETFDSRRVVEVELIRRAALGATKADLRELDAMMSAHASVLNDPVGFRILDSRFHDKIYSMGRNAILARMAASLYSMGLDLRRRATEEPGAIAVSTSDHQQILDAFRAGDPDAAAKAMLGHIAHIEASTVRMLEPSKVA